MSSRKQFFVRQLVVAGMALGLIVSLEWGASGADLPQLAERARAAKDSIRPISQGDVDVAKSDLLQSMQRLKSFLSSRSIQNWEGWQDYLLWSQLEAELAAESPNVQALSQTGQKLFADVEGLDRPEFLTFRSSLKKYVTYAAYFGQENFQETVADNLEKLAELLEQQAADPSTETVSQIGLLAGNLESQNQAPGLLQDVRNAFFQPNFFAQISGNLIRSSMVEPVSDHSEVNDVIVGSRVFGQAHTVGQVTSDISRSANRGSLLLRFNGAVRSNTYSPNGPVTICSTATTDFTATKAVTIDANGIRYSPSTASATTNSQITGIKARNNLIRFFANQQAGKKKGQAQYESARKAEVRIAKSLDEQANDLLIQANQQFHDSFRRPLLRRDGFPQMLALATPGDYLNVTWKQSNDYQLAADSAPAGLSSRYDFSGWIHESMVGNYSAAVLGGKKYDNVQVAELVEELGEDPPTELTEGDAWSITFAPQSPISARFVDGLLTIGIEGVRWTREDDVLNQRIRVSATYAPSISPAGLLLERQGDVDVTLVGRARLGAKQIAFKTFLSKKFEGLFPQQRQVGAPEMQAPWERIGKLDWREIQSNDGWLSIGLDRRPQVAAPTVVHAPQPIISQPIQGRAIIDGVR